MTHVFISYSHEDADYARHLSSELQSRGIKTWMDEQIPKGALWAKVVIDNLIGSSALAVIMTPAAEESEWVQKELLIALDRKLPIFPLLLSGHVFPLLIDRQYDDVRGAQMPSQAFVNRYIEIVGFDHFVKNAGGMVEITDEMLPALQNEIRKKMQAHSENVYLAALETHFADILREMPAEFTAHQFILKLAQGYQSDYIRALAAYQEHDAPFRDLHGQISKRLKASGLVTAHGKAPSKNIWGESAQSEVYRKP
jgi:hypothetical protein